jgi:hypothetical protein
MTASQEYKDNVQHASALVVIGLWAAGINNLESEELSAVTSDERVLAEAMSDDLDSYALVKAISRASKQSMGVMATALDSPKEMLILTQAFENCVREAQAL